MWKSLERESAMIFSVLLICCEYRDVSLLKRVQKIQQAMASCDSEFTGSKYVLCVKPSVLYLSVNSKMCEPCPSCWIVVYIDIFDASCPRND